MANLFHPSGVPESLLQLFSNLPPHTHSRLVLHRPPEGGDREALQRLPHGRPVRPLLRKIHTLQRLDAATRVHVLVWKKISHIFSVFKSFVLSSVVASED